MAEGSDKTVDLYGAFRHKVDAKGRLSLPASFRKVLADDLVVIRHPVDECLYVFEPQDFNTWVAKLFVDKYGGFDDTKKEHRMLRSALRSSTSDVTVDATGRILLSAEKRAAAGIDKDVVIVGNTGYFEIWDAQRYDQVMSETDLGLLFS